jgi:cytochrome d ubiquinol oxidase subunit II
VISILGGVASLGLLYWGRFHLARGASAVAVAAVLWGWAVGQYPNLLDSGLTIEGAAAVQSVLAATAICLGVGAVILVPSLTWLYLLFQRGPASGSGAGST